MSLQTTATIGLTIEQYHVEVRRMNLHPTNISGLYVCLATGDAHEMTFNVDSPDELTPEERAEAIEHLRRKVGS